MQHLAFIEGMEATFKSQTYYKPPSYHGLRTNLLKQSKVDVSKTQLLKDTKFHSQIGTTIYYDVWSNVARHPLLNVMFVYPNGNVFIGAIDTTWECKDAYIYITH